MSYGFPELTLLEATDNLHSPGLRVSAYQHRFLAAS